MESEKIKIYTEDSRYLGIAAREDIHRQGHWHQTFHCWFISRRDGKTWIHLQLRSGAKKDFPYLFDITAAGHILSTETVADGVREVKEELGIAVEFEDLVPLGIIKDQIHQAGFIDNEHCHNFLYRVNENSDLRFELQIEEVTGMVSAEFQAFSDLCKGKRERIAVEGFEIEGDGTVERLTKTISKNDLVPHSSSYLEQVAIRIQQVLEKDGFLK
ncbi:NUDIX domain-containing protein [Planococcus shenhongbingii]|uniref:NUDIX hydrolase n=1 Tax=Planococcus shenhongbingii TaxID=3058398 RepID=UPI002601A2E2|nr:NUDIX domain-containing protein [Planococcus sp. N016]WKA58773.1 NUDIX domain-containing protein [Planococcus sp. N016]